MTAAEFIDNPNWVKCIEEFQESPIHRHLITHEDCSSLDVESAAAHLMRNGAIGRAIGYEERPGQLDMLKAIALAFNHREHLMIEAGTGVGKSLAYLVPSILWAWTNDTPVIISTATRNLQSQLISSDIPRALTILGDDAAKFKVALLKGRANYVCLRAVDELFSGGYWTMDGEYQRLMPDFISWLQSTHDGDLDGYDALPRSLLNCPGEECSGHRCPFFSRCFVYRARKLATSAHLVIANHALVLADATSSGGILPAYNRLILDEAHNLEDIATEYLSYEFSVPALTRILNRLLRKKGHRRGVGGVVAAIEKQLQRGALASSPAATRIVRILQDISKATVRVVNAADELSDVASLLLRRSERHEICRFKFENDVRMHSVRGLFAPFDAGEWDEAVLIAARSKFEASLALMVNLLHELRDILDDPASDGETSYAADISMQISGIADSLVAFANETDFVLNANKPTHTYWIERVRPEKRSSYVRLVAAPLSVADDLRRTLYGVKDSVILASATLRVGNDFKYMSRRLGFGDEANPEQAARYRSLTASSPFDYFRQSLVLAPDCMPDPSADPKQYARALASMMQDLFSATRGRALVLFTSYEMMNAVAGFVRDPLQQAGISLFVQGDGMSRECMTSALRDAGCDAASKVVLFGAQSFWEGVDVAGEALSCVVLTRLPFAQVGEPIVEARAEKVNKDGGSAFRDYSLPEAVIKFRQGFGRLIRSQSDRGVVIVTDPRIVTKNYGAIFRRSIPATTHTITDLPTLLENVRQFFTE